MNTFDYNGEIELPVVRIGGKFWFGLTEHSIRQGTRAIGATVSYVLTHDLHIGGAIAGVISTLVGGLIGDKVKFPKSLPEGDKLWIGFEAGVTVYFIVPVPWVKFLGAHVGKHP